MVNPDIPLVDLHRHLDGNIQPALIHRLAKHYQLPLAEKSIQEITQMSQILDKTADLLAFLAKLDVGVSVLVDNQACYDVAYDNIRDAKQGGLDYVELRFSPRYMASAFDLPMVGVLEAVIAGVQDGCRDFGVGSNLIGILSRHYGVDACMEELNALCAVKEGIRALDLAGDELNYPAELYVEHFKIARDNGWNITVHAGEADGPKSIWNAIQLLGATRIGHGVAAAQDHKLMDYMAHNKIAVESCPTSNYQTATVADLSSHPLQTFIDKGMLVTLNTDDPGVSNITLAHEYLVAAEQMGVDRQSLDKIQRDGVEAAFLTDSEKQTLWQTKKPS